MLTKVSNHVILQDTSSIGVVVVRHFGYTAVVKVINDARKKNSGTDVLIDDQPEGGAHALNVNR